MSSVRTLLVSTALVFLPATHARNAAASDTSQSLLSSQIKEIRLDNGLRIAVLEKPTSPTFAALYQFGVGGAMDPKGRSGIAHLLEHMMFKGSATIGVTDGVKERALLQRQSMLWHTLHTELDRQADPFAPADPATIEALKKQISALDQQLQQLTIQNEYDELVTRAGGVGMNAQTSNDFTHYFVQLPSNRLEFWFALESERLLRPVFREFYAERDVVQEERRLRYDNSPDGQMFEAQKALLFDAHPYATPVIGWPADLQRLTVEDAMDYFRTYYSPSNCQMMLVGDIKASEVERLAKKYFSAWKRQSIPRLQITADMEPSGERRRVVEFDAEPKLSAAWRTVALGEKDQSALELLGRVLGGLESSRLDQSIVQGERIASYVSASQTSMRYGGWFTVQAAPSGAHTTAELEAAFTREIVRIQESGVTVEELERAKVQTEVGRAQTLTSNLGLAQLIGSALRTAGSVRWLDESVARINAVTPAEIQRVAKQYLTPARRAVIEIRKTPGGAKAVRGGEARVDQHGGVVGQRGQRHSSGFTKLIATVRAAPKLRFKLPEVGKEVERVVLPSGVTVFVREDHTAPIVNLGFTWLGGTNSLAVDQLAPFELADSLLTEGGTETLAPAALQERQEALGMSFSIYTSGTTCGASFRSLRRTFDLAWPLAIEMVMKPRLDEERLQTIKGQYIESMKRRYESPGLGAAAIVSHVMWKDHPRFGYTVSRQQIEAITPAQVRDGWARFTGRDNLYIVAVGDFDKQQLLARIEETFSGWRTAADKSRVWLSWEPRTRPGVYTVEKDLPQPAVRLVQNVAIDRRAPEADHAALEILNDILGGSGFRSRLMERLRTGEGLTYGVSSSLSHQGRPDQPGTLIVSYQTKQASVARSVQVAIEEIAKIVNESVTAAEVAEQIESWRNRFVFGFTNDFAIVNRMLSNELDDRPYDQAKRTLDAVQLVQPIDIRRVAQRYLKPADLTIAVYGTLSDDDRKQFAASGSLSTLQRDDVFPGGYSEGPLKQSPVSPQ
ncbi:MAG: pitrilysin family protein [Acidobacteriota bacterium]